MQTEIVRGWLSYKEAEQLVGLSRTTRWKLLSAGEIDYRRVGRTVKICRESLEAYMRRPAGSSTVGTR
jgi:excisionase family DNA binding protein